MDERGRHGSTRVIIHAASLSLLITVIFVLSYAGPATVLGGATFSPATNSPRAGLTPPALATLADWPTYLQNPSRTSANLAPTTLSSSNIKTVDTLWTYKTKATVSGTTNTISASTAVVHNVAYFGSWDGYEYAVNASTGKLIWSSFLGVAKTKGCGNQGIASSATVENGSLFVGGGDGNWYALNAATGTVEWSVLIGNPSEGYYNWASPLIFEGYAYIGVSSFCDDPLVPGGLLQVNLTTHVMQHFFATTSAGVLGSSVWGSPSIDAKTNTVYFATGNDYPHVTGPFADAVVAVSATNVSKLVSSWTIPPSQVITDGDFGSTTTLFQTSGGTTLVGALDKNGYFYAFNASNLAAGPLWRDHVTTGQGVGSAAFAQGLVYIASGSINYKGTYSSGAAWALNPNNGVVAWEQPLWGKSTGSAPAYANGLLLVDGGTHVFVLNATTGMKIKEPSCGSADYSTPTIAENEILVGCSNGQEFALGIPPTKGSTASPISALRAIGESHLIVLVREGLPRWV
ncbi:MAG: PQQ-binding-like beta-propeller repeat protein [Thermoplasmata archaeon]